MEARQLKPTNDYIFKKIFGTQKNSDLLKSFLKALLPDLKIDKVKIDQDVFLENEDITKKYSRLDIKATLEDNTIIDIEMQVQRYYDTVERALYYTAGLLHNSMHLNDEYNQVSKVICIWILDFDLFDKGPYHEIGKIKRDYENIILTDKLEIHFIQLPKFRAKFKKISSVLDEWLTFISFKDKEELKMIKTKEVKKAEEEFEYLTGEAAERRRAEMREEAEWEERYFKQVICKRVAKEAAEEGEKRGKKEGITQAKLETAKKMLDKKMNVETIQDITGLEKEEIENLVK